MPASVPVSRAALKETSFHRLPSDWFGRPALHQACFALGLRAGRLTYRFRAGKAPECDGGLALGSFQEGLWEQDVAELFVMAAGPEYHELNLSPTGAWWSASFSSYRAGAAEQRLSSVQTRAQWDGSAWTSEISFDLAELPVLGGCSPEQARLNVCAILHPPKPEFLCYAHTGGGEPDFHRADLFRPFQLL
jgi:hypothetical protein